MFGSLFKKKPKVDSYKITELGGLYFVQKNGEAFQQGFSDCEDALKLVRITVKHGRLDLTKGVTIYEKEVAE